MSKLIDILKEKNHLTMNADGRIVVVPLSQFEFRTSPLKQGEQALLISQDAYLGLLLKIYQFDDSLKNIVDFSAEQFSLFMKNRFKNMPKGD